MPWPAHDLVLSLACPQLALPPSLQELRNSPGARMPDRKINWALLGLFSPLLINNSRKVEFMQQCWLRMETGRRGNVLEKSIPHHGNRRQLGLQNTRANFLLPF